MQIFIFLKLSKYSTASLELDKLAETELKEILIWTGKLQFSYKTVLVINPK